MWLEISSELFANFAIQLQTLETFNPGIESIFIYYMYTYIGYMRWDTSTHWECERSIHSEHTCMYTNTFQQ